MTWTYSGDPGNSDLDQARFYVQDTVKVRPLLSDEEILFVLDAWAPVFNSPLYAAAVCAEIIAGRYIDEVNVSADGVNVDQGSLFQRYNDLAASLRDQYKALTGQDVSRLAELNSTVPDASIDPLSFGVGMDDNYRAGQQQYGGVHTGWSPEFEATPDGASL